MAENRLILYYLIDKDCYYETFSADINTTSFAVV
jgi:hypothetical protein